MKALWRLLRLFRPYAGWMLLGVVVATATLAANVALMATSGWFLASMAIAGAAGVSMNYFTPAAIIRAAAIVRTAGRYLERLITHETTFRLLAELRVWFYRHLEPLAPAGVEAYRSGDLLSRIRADIDTLDGFYVRILVPVAVAAVAIVSLTWFLAGYDTVLAAVLCVGLVAAGVLLPWWGARLGRQPGRRAVAEAAALRTLVVDAVQGMGELTVSGATDEVAGRIAQRSERLIAAQARLSRIGGRSQAAMQLIASLTLWSLVIVAIPLVGADAVAPQELAMLALFSLAAFEAVAPLPEAFRLLGHTLAAAARIFAIADSPPPVAEPVDGGRSPGDCDLQFVGVDYRYDDSAPAALRDFSLMLPPGRRVAIVGATGSGKSTLIQLLLRFRIPTAGRILLDSHPIDDYSGETLRERIAVVPQKVHLFNTTIRANLQLACPDAAPQQLAAACEIAQLDRFIRSQSQGYDTWVGETGVKLSGGQARRLAIARALLRDFRVLVLDEPGEGIDSLTERALLKALLRHLGDRTLLLITHHAVGLDQMDQILVLDRGLVCERGGYGELLQRNGRFAQLFGAAGTVVG